MIFLDTSCFSYVFAVLFPDFFVAKAWPCARNSCMETGGIGSDTPDAKPWWRVSLERTQLLQPGA